MKLSDKELRDIALALYLASQWEDSVIDSYSTCAKDPVCAKQIVEHKANIKRFLGLRDRVCEQIKERRDKKESAYLPRLRLGNENADDRG